MSIPELGSSKITRRGSPVRASATDSRRLKPPDNALTCVCVCVRARVRENVSLETTRQRTDLFVHDRAEVEFVAAAANLLVPVALESREETQVFFHREVIKQNIFLGTVAEVFVDFQEIPLAVNAAAKHRDVPRGGEQLAREQIYES